jgi:predicted O-methyltransferase YrrM
VLAAGRVVDPGNDQEQVLAIRETNDLIASDDRVDSAMVAIADGLMLARKR